MSAVDNLRLEYLRQRSFREVQLCGEIEKGNRDDQLEQYLTDERQGIRRAALDRWNKIKSSEKV